MAAGGPGDHPLSDILDYKLTVYGSECDELIHQISKYMSRDEMWDAFDWYDKTYKENPIKFASVLSKALEEVMRDRKERGWEL